MIKFDSYNLKYKSIFGAIETEQNVRFDFWVRKDIRADFVNIVIRKNNTTTLKLQKTEVKDGYDIFSITTSFVATGLYRYRFEIVKPDGKMLFTGTSDGHTAVIGDWLDEWYLCVYDKNFYTSDITRGAVMYQIFPDRFFRAEGVDTSGARNERIIHTNWNERPMCFYDCDDFRCNDFFMGNLKGIEQKLDYIKSLGVTHIYLNPIFESAQNHRYCTSDYLNVDPYLGNVNDFKSLCKKAHDYDIKIIIDGVFSHTGDDSIYFNKYKNYGDGGAYNDKSSPYYTWYNFKDSRDEYDCWWGFETLPNVNETNESYLEFITGDNGVLSFWQNLGADGFRLDVADELPDEFLKKLRTAVKKNNKDALIIGEVWENAVTKHSYGKQREFLLGKQCDSVMNYPFLNAITDFVISGKAEDFYKSIMEIMDMYPKPSIKCLMNSISTHDTSRAINRLGVKDTPQKHLQSKTTLTDEQYSLGEHRLVTAAAIQYTLPGIPCLYYADEAGAQGFGDPACRGTYPWEKVNTKLLKLHKQLAIIRKEFADEFESDIVFEQYSDGIIKYRRGKLRIIANGSPNHIKADGKPIWSYLYKTELEPGGVLIEEVF